MSKFDEIPEIKEGMINYKNYAEKEIKACELKIKRLSDCIEEINKRIILMVQPHERKN